MSRRGILVNGTHKVVTRPAFRVGDRVRSVMSGEPATVTDADPFADGEWVTISYERVPGLIRSHYAHQFEPIDPPSAPARVCAGCSAQADATWDGLCLTCFRVRENAPAASYEVHRSTAPDDEDVLTCTIHELARAIFDTDPRVVAWLDVAAEYPGAWDERWEARRNRIREKAWERDEQGWAHDAIEKADAIVTAIRGGAR